MRSGLLHIPPSKGFARLGVPAVLMVWALATAPPDLAANEGQAHTWRLHARVVAVGLPGVAGIRQIGRFHSGGPIPGNPEFLMSTGSGRILDPERLMVAVTGNFGSPPSDPSQAPGAILSIDPGSAASGTIVIPENFAVSGGQRTVLGGAVQLYTSQSEEFRNSRFNAGARTANFTAASGPRYLSINNAFGRPWIANAPDGLDGEGSVTVVDPDGAPLDNAPNSKAGGVFAGERTNREWLPIAQPSGWIARLLNYRASPQLTRGGLNGGALGTAFLGPSPDGSGFAVFAAVTGAGSVVQIHVQDGVDGLAAPGTASIDPHTGDGPGVIGMAFKWNPQRVLYVADPARNRLMLLHLRDDRRHFSVMRTDTIGMPALNRPVDIAAAMPEIANPHFSSHTTLAGGSDLYIANRGDGSLLRISQDGRPLARAEIEIPGMGLLGGDRIRAIAVSADTQRLWLTIEGELPDFAGHAGALIEVSAFDQQGVFSEPGISTMANGDQAETGEHLFQQTFTTEMGLGPLFNASSCVACHPGPGGASFRDEHFVRRVAHMDPVTGRVVPIDHPNSPVAHRHSLGGLFAMQPRQANVSSLRMPLALFGLAQLDEIPDSVIEAQAVSKGDGIKGRANYVVSAKGEQRVGRYGWKADIATLEEMVANAFANELGITTALAPSPRPGAQTVEDDGRLVSAVAAYLRTLSLPRGAAP